MLALDSVKATSLSASKPTIISPRALSSTSCLPGFWETPDVRSRSHGGKAEASPAGVPMSR